MKGKTMKELELEAKFIEHTALAYRLNIQYPKLKRRWIMTQIQRIEAYLDQSARCMVRGDINGVNEAQAVMRKLIGEF